MTWFTETPWPPIFILGLASGVMVAVWTSQKRGIWLLGALAMVLAAVAVFVVERSIVTEAERVEKDVHDLAAAFVREDRDTVLSYFSVQAPELRAMALEGMELVDFPNGLDIKDMSVRVTNENSRAVAHFRANGVVSVSVAGLRDQRQMASRWEVTWQKEGPAWKIIEVIRLHPFKDDRMKILEQQPQ